MKISFGQYYIPYNKVENDKKNSFSVVKSGFISNKQHYKINFTGANDIWEKTRNIGKSFVDRTKEVLFDFSSLFQNKDIEITEEEEAFLESYMEIEENIKAKYDKKIADIKDGFWDSYTGKSEKKRQKLRDEKENALKVAYQYQETFEQREREAINNKIKFYELAKQLNMSKEILVAFESAQLTSKKRLEIIAKRKEILDKKGFSQIAGYVEEKSKLQEDFLDKLDDEKSGKYVKGQIPNAILFYGPTGCGKTTFVKALAEEADCNFIAVQCRGTQKDKEQKLYETLMGYKDTDEFDDEIVVSGLLDKAQKKFLETGRRTIILIDEFDRFFGKDVSNNFINMLKGILESCSEDNHVTFFLTTNKPQKIPYELRNSHRIEPVYPLDPPNKVNTIAVIEHYLQGFNIENLDYNIILSELFKYAPNEIYSNTHLKAICEIATDEIKAANTPITTDLFIQAIKKYNESNEDSNLLRITREFLEQYEKDKATI